MIRRVCGAGPGTLWLEGPGFEEDAVILLERSDIVGDVVMVTDDVVMVTDDVVMVTDDIVMVTDDVILDVGRSSSLETTVIL
jgi:hypothetical protein